MIVLEIVIADLEVRALEIPREGDKVAAALKLLVDELWLADVFELDDLIFRRVGKFEGFFSTFEALNLGFLHLKAHSSLDLDGLHDFLDVIEFGWLEESFELVDKVGGYE